MPKPTPPPPSTWGGARPGAGRKPRERLNAPELAVLLDLCETGLYAKKNADLAEKIRRMIAQETK